MFHSLEAHQSIFHTIQDTRVKSPYASQVVARQFLDAHDFGSVFFQKVLDRSILKPGSIQAGK